MRKSFTRLFSVVMLLGMIMLSAVAFGIASGPQLATQVPIDGFSNYDGSSGKLIVTLTFNQDVVPGAQHAGIIGLRNDAGQLDPIQISGLSSTNALTGSSAVISGKTVTVTFLRKLTQDEKYFITVSPDALMNSSGEYFMGIGNAVYDITIGDFTKPVIATTGTPAVPNLVPRDGSSANALAANLTATFSETIAKGTGNIGIYTSAGNVVELFDVAASPRVTVAGNVLTIDPTNDLKEFENYYVRIAPTAITDADENHNAFAGINDNSKWNFQAADVTAPAVAFVPVAATDIQKSQIMTLTFSDARTSHGLTFEVRKNVAGDKFAANAAAPVVFQSWNGAWVDVPAGNYTAKYTAVNQVTIAWVSGQGFVSGTKYRIGVADNAYFDEEDNAVAAVTKEFTTGDFDAPVITASVTAAGIGAAPNDVAADKETTKLFVKATITDASAKPVEVHYLIVAYDAAAPSVADVMAGPVLPVNADDNTLHQGFATTTGAGATLASNTKYDVYFAAKDKATVPNTSTTLTKVNDVLTNDIVAPVPTAKVNVVGAADPVTIAADASVSKVLMNSPVTISFDEAVADPTANVTVKYWDGSLETPAWVTLAAPADYSVAFAGNELTINGAHADIAALPNANWRSQGQYKVILSNQVADDLTGKTGTPNRIAEKVYTFTAEDYVGPIAVFKGTNLTSIIKVATTANVEIDLGEACTRANGSAIDANNVFFRDNTGNIVPADITVSGGRYITIDPNASLADGNSGTTYSIELTLDLKDAAGNKLSNYKGNVAIAGATNHLTFTTGDETRPPVTFALGATPLPAVDQNKNVNNRVINVNIDEVVFKADGKALTASDANYLRTVVSVVKVSDNTPIYFDITNNAAQSFDIDLKSFLAEYTPEETYKVTVNGLFDASGNAITNNSSTFSIREYTLPTVVSYSPVDGSALVANNTPIKITFSEPVRGILGKTITLYRDDVPTSWTLDARDNTTISGNVVTLDVVEIDPAFAFAVQGTYHVEYQAQAFRDLAGNRTEAAITDATTWNWSAYDNIKPIVANKATDLVPADDAVNVEKPAQIKITFTEASGKMFAGAGSIFIREAGNVGIPDFSIPAQSSSVSIVNNVVTISLNAATFKYNTDYWVEIQPNAFKDAAGNYFAGYVNDATAWNFKTVADPAPYYLVNASSPATTSNNVALNAPVVVKFSEPVNFKTKVGKYITIRNRADNTAHHTVYFDGPAAAYSFNANRDELTINHPDFLANSEYYVTISTGTFQDDANQLIAAANDLDDASDLWFTTEDKTAPVISAITVNGTDVNSSLANAPTGIAKNGKIVITFSEPVTIATPNTAVVLNDGAPVASTATFVDNVLTITPTANLGSGRTITVSVAAGAIKDKGKNTLPVADGLVGKFVVLDYENPIWDSPLLPSTAGNNSVVIHNLSINEPGKIFYYAVPKGTFSSTPSAASVMQNATGSWTTDGGVADLTINGLLGDTSYDIYFTAQDVVPNVMDGTTPGQTVISIYDLRTLDNVAPVLLTSFNTDGFTAGLTPADNATCIATNAVLKMKFNEKIGAVDATKFWVRKVSDNTSVGVLPYTASVDNDVVTITFAGLAQNTEYYVEINPNAIHDLNGNAWNDFIFGNGRWNFATRDEAPLTVATKSPADNAVKVFVGANNSLTLEFNKNVVKNTTSNVFIDIYRTGSATPHERIDVSTDAVTVSGKVATITRKNVYASESSYYVLVPANAFFDTACEPNYFAGYTLDTEWNFTTQDITAPVVSWTPNGSSAVNPGAAIKMMVNEDLFNGNTALNGSDLKAQFAVVDNNGAVTVSSAVYSSVNDEVTLTLASALTSNNTYTVTYTSVATVADAAGNAVPSSSVTFNTEDRLSPVVTITATQMNAANPSEVLTGTKFLVTFNKKVLKANGPSVNVTPTAADLKNADFLTMDGVAFTGTVTVVTPGLVYELTPAAALTSTSHHEFVWTANFESAATVKDELYFPNGNVLNLPIAKRTFKFDTEDVAKPLQDGLTPATANPLAIINSDSKLTISFNEKVVGNNAAGKITIRYANGQIFDEINPESCAFGTADPFNVVITPNKNFDAHREYYVEIPAGAFTDASFNKNPFAGFLGNTTWKFRTDDGIAPTVVSLSPINNGVANNSNLVMTFSENIQLGAAGAKLVIYFNNGDTPDGNAKEIIDVADASKVTVSGSNPVDPNKTSNVVTINPAMTFDYNAPGEYYVRVDAGFVKDFAQVPSANLFAGINDNTTWKFGIADPTRPSLVYAALNPAVGATNVAKKLNGVTMKFDRDVMAGAGTIRLYQYNYTTTPFTETTKLIETVNVSNVVIDHTAFTATFDFAAELEDNTIYYILADNGSFTNTTVTHDWWVGITDPFAWRFTTGDFTAPTVTATPANGDTMPLTFDVTLTFSEKVTGVSASTLAVSSGVINSVTADANGTTYLVNITAPSLATVKLTVPVTVKDLGGNALAATTFTYKVDNFDAPELVSWTPADESKAISKDTSLVMTFSKPVVPGSGKINVYNSLSQLFKSYTLTAENISGTKVTVPVTGLASEMTYVVTFEANTVKDAQGLPVAALTDPTKWNFTVADFTAPKVVNVTPANAASAPKTFDVTIEFSEDVVGVKENISVNKGTVVVKGTGKVYIATITGTDGDEIALTIGKNITDATKKNTLDADVVKTYTIGDYTAPTVVVTDPATPVSTVFTVGLTFNEPVTGVADAITVTGGKLDDVTGSGKDYVLTISAKEQTSVSIVLGNTIKDTAPNANAFAGQTLTYKTGDFTAPALVTKTPTLDNTLSDTHPTFKMTFNEDVKLGAGGSLKVYKVNSTTVVLDIPVTAAMINGKEVTVNYATVSPGLEKSTRYYVKVDGSALTDAAGNAFVGVSDIAAWTFKTGANWPTPNIDQLSLEFKVYPNPFVDFVNVANASQLSKVVVTNIAGQTVKEVVNPTEQIQLNELRSGVYFISLYDMDNVIAKTAKIVKR